MGFKIKIRQSDKIFSQFIRKRDKKCIRCFSPVQFNESDMPISHQCSHFYGRRHEASRHDPDNGDCLCGGCHQIWGGDGRREYEAFKKKQLGDKRFKELQIRAEVSHYKKDEKLAVIIAKQLLNDISTH